VWGAAFSGSGDAVTKVLAGPGDGNGVLFELHEGAPVLVTDRGQSGYLKVQLSDGKSGWIAASQYKVFAPPVCAICSPPPKTFVVCRLSEARVTSAAASLKTRYIELLLTSGVLSFGDFTTKSGRRSPYFFNTGRFDSGARIAAAGAAYAELIADRFGATVENLFGPAYKGIPLAVATASALSQRLGRDVSFTFNRKEAKDHGEGGLLVGRAYTGGEKVVVIEDVITGGTSFNETMPLLARYGVEVIGAVVGVDRQERGTGAASAFAEVRERYGVATAAIVTIDDVVQALHDRTVLGKVWIDDAARERIADYLSRYGG
jgi:orotate phosphoribosyltransferase